MPYTALNLAINELAVGLALVMRRLQAVEDHVGLHEPDLTGGLLDGLTRADEV